MKKVFSKTIYKELSPVSGKIVVTDNGETRELFVKDVKQTSWSDNETNFEGTYWKAAVSIPFEISNNPRFLVVGLGGGTIPKLLAKKYANSQIICLEIDSMIIDIANKFFGLHEYQNIKVIKANANTWIYRNVKKYSNSFNGIFLDGFFGETFSLDTDMNAIQKIYTMLTSEGVMITNRIYNDYEKKVDKFITDIGELFSEQVTHIIEGYSGNDNIVIFSKKSS